MELEIKVLWCRGLSAFNFFQKLTVYAAALIESEDQRIKLTQEQKQEQKTPVDEDGDGNPEWNHTMKFDLTSISNDSHSKHSNFSLLFEFRHHTQLFPDRNIGEVRVPLRDLVESVGNDVVRFASYEIRSTDGKPNGVLDFSYKVIGGLEKNGGSDLDSGVNVTGYSNRLLRHCPRFHDPDHDRSLSDEEEENSEKIEYQGKILYPKIELGKLGEDHLVPSAPPFVGGDEKEQFHHYYYPPNPSLRRDEKEEFQYYPPPPSMGRDEIEQFQYYPPHLSPATATATATTYYPPLSYAPPGPPMWGPPPAHYLPPPVPQHLVYPPPPPQPQPLYGERSWEYHRPSPPHYQQSGGGYENHHW